MPIYRRVVALMKPGRWFVKIYEAMVAMNILTHLFPNGKYAGREKGWQAESVTDKAIYKRKQANAFFSTFYAQPMSPGSVQRNIIKYLDKGLRESYAMFMGMMEHLDSQVGVL